jgi:hypothetical protein
MGALPKIAVKEIWQETVRILNDSCIPKNNLTGVGRKSLQAMKAAVEPIVLSADKGSAAMVVSTTHYNWNISAFWRTKNVERGRKILLSRWCAKPFFS